MSKIIILGIAIIILGFSPLYSHFTQASLSKEERLALFSPVGLITDYFAPTGEAIVHNELRHFRKLNQQIYYFFPIPLAQYGFLFKTQMQNHLKHWLNTSVGKTLLKKTICAEKISPSIKTMCIADFKKFQISIHQA